MVAGLRHESLRNLVGGRTIEIRERQRLRSIRICDSDIQKRTDAVFQNIQTEEVKKGIK